MPLLTILTPCFNEEDNVREVYEQVKAAMATHPGLRLRPPVHRQRLDGSDGARSFASLRPTDKRVKVIVNTRNFGHVRSPYHAFLEARGDAVMSLRRRPAGPARADPGVRRTSGARATRSSSA